MEPEILEDKRGAEKFFSIWWFLVLVVVGVGIVAGVLIFFSSDVDIRKIEADGLNTKITDCIVEQGFLIDQASGDNFDVFKRCGLNKDVFSKGSNFFLKISFLDESGTSFREPILEGDFSFEQDCKVQEPVKGDEVVAEKFSKCTQQKYNVLYYDDGQIKTGVLDILAASNQKGGKVPIAK